RCRKAAVRDAQVSAVSRARRHSEGSADGKPGARPAHGRRSAAARLDSRVAEEAVGHPAWNAHAGLLARVSEVALSGSEHGRGGPGSRHSRSSADSEGWTDPAKDARPGQRELTLRSQVW